MLSESLAVSRDQAQKQPLQVVDAALRADASALPALTGVNLGAQGYMIVKILKVLPREASLEAAAKQERSQYSQWWAAAESMAYYAVLKDRFKADIKVVKPVRAKADQLPGSETTTTQ